MPILAKPATGLLVAAALVLAGGPPAPARAATWTVDHDASRIAVIGTQTGDTFEAEFQDFEADIAFDPDNLAASSVTVTIDVGSFESGNEDRDELAMDNQWFDVETWPLAEFRASTFRHLDGNRYEADGTLRIRDVSRDITLPFTLTIADGTATMHGQIEVNRSNFNLGQGDFASGELVGFDVTIVIDLRAQRAG